MILTFNVYFEQDPDGGYLVTIPELPEAISHGATLEEAKANILEAAKLVMADEAVLARVLNEIETKKTFISRIEVDTHEVSMMNVVEVKEPE